jgi:hypothetical protein
VYRHCGQLYSISSTLFIFNTALKQVRQRSSLQSPKQRTPFLYGS